MVPKRDNVLATRLDHTPRILHLRIFLVPRLGHGTIVATRALEERLPARTRAHAHLERAIRRQRRRGGGSRAGGAAAAAATHAADTPRVMFRRDEAREGLLDIPQWR